MASAMIGANPDELRRLSREFQQASAELDAIANFGGKGIFVASLMQLTGTSWLGPRAVQFANEWTGRIRPRVQEAALAMRDAAHALEANAAEQEQASGGGVGTIHIQPKAPDEMGQTQSLPTISLADDQFRTQNVSQGQLGDCWLIADIEALVKTDPEFVRNHIFQNPDGTYTVILYKNGQPEYVVVDADAPLHAAGSPISPGNTGPNWVTIYEKAVAEHFGSYSQLDGDVGHHTVAEGMEVLTGRGVTYQSDASFADIEAGLRKGPVVVSSEANPKTAPKTLWWYNDDVIDDYEVVPNHAYAVDKIEMHFNIDTGQEERMIHILNPWGVSGSSYENAPQAGLECPVDLWLTEAQYQDNFRGASVMEKDVPSTL